MNRTHSLFLAIGFAVPIFTANIQAADPSAVETKLRESLRSTMLQLRTSQNDLATLQATQAETDQKNKTLTAQLNDLTIKAAADKDAAAKSLADLDAKLMDREAEIARLNEALAKWKAGYQQATDLAQKKEVDRAKLADENAALQRKVDDQQTRNTAMFKLGNEILTRYQKFGIGDALTAREPFVGLTRVKFQNLIQDYQDQLSDQKIKP